MGAPKLLLPWGWHTVIEQVLGAWRASRVERFVVVAHPDDGELADLCRATGADVVVPESPPPDMRASIEIGVRFLDSACSPNHEDVWLTAPADLPLLQPHWIDRLIESYRPETRSILVAAHGGRRGHPVLFAWPLAAEVFALTPGLGINSLLESRSVMEIELGPDTIGGDLDTPGDLDRLRNRQ